MGSQPWSDALLARCRRLHLAVNRREMAWYRAGYADGVKAAMGVVAEHYDIPQSAVEELREDDDAS